VKTICRKQIFYRLEWPGHSPDLNHIENLLSIKNSRLQNLHRTTMNKVIKAMISVVSAQ